MALKKKKVNRFKEYDYSTNGAYFVTMCTEDRKCTLSTIVGDITERMLKKTEFYYDHVIRNERDHIENTIVY